MSEAGSVQEQNDGVRIPQLVPALTYLAVDRHDQWRTAIDLASDVRRVRV